MRVLNIFTDASIKHTDTIYETIGCAGFISAVGDDNNIEGGQQNDTKLKTLDMYYTILPNTTNNIAEATGVLRGVQYAVAHKDQFDRINIFSDSQWCIKSLTTWIFDWINTIDNMGVMYNSSQSPVSNQTIFNEIIMTIVDTRTKLHFYHCKGHVIRDSKEGLFDALKVFRISNLVPEYIHMNFHQVYVMAYYNDYIDTTTRDVLNKWILSGYTLDVPIDYPRPIFYILSKDIINIYKSLIE